MRNSCELNEVTLHVNQISFSYERMSTYLTPPPLTPIHVLFFGKCGKLKRLCDLIVFMGETEAEEGIRKNVFGDTQVNVFGTAQGSFGNAQGNVFGETGGRI